MRFRKIQLILTVAACLVAMVEAAMAGYVRLPPRETIITCQDVCVRKASAPKPGGHPSGHLERQCVNTLTGQFIGTRPIPATPCGP